MAPVAAVEPWPLKLTVSGACPAAVDEERTAVGGVACVMGVEAVTVAAVMLVWPVASVTVSLVVYAPAVE